MPLYLTNPIDGSRWAVVPEKATEDMCTAHEMADIEDSLRDAHAYQSESWDVMLAAAPEFPVEVMVENAARSLCDIDPDSCGWVNMTDAYQTRMRHTARAILAKVFEVKP